MATALSATAASVDPPQAEIVPMAVLDAPSSAPPTTLPPDGERTVVTDEDYTINQATDRGTTAANPQTNQSEDAQSAHSDTLAGAVCPGNGGVNDAGRQSDGLPVEAAVAPMGFFGRFAALMDEAIQSESDDSGAEGSDNDSEGNSDGAAYVFPEGGYPGDRDVDMADVAEVCPPSPRSRPPKVLKSTQGSGIQQTSTE
ncbi:hypothetical protein PInf_017984 [Phytophthora infestans]|nr:hypothetical protein PInf_017984 [Phytophthora infestans]